MSKTKVKKNKTKIHPIPFICTCENSDAGSFFPVFKSKKAKTFNCPFCHKKYNRSVLN